MALFGPLWEGYMEKIEKAWKEKVGKDDLVLIPGDISWAMRLEEALTDLQWIDALPGTKLLLRGNHDYWWTSMAKMSKVMPPSIRFIQNSTFDWNDVSIGGARLWDTDEFSFAQYIHFQENPKEKKIRAEIDDAKIFERELQRLRLSLEQLNPHAKMCIALTHYPPISADLQASRGWKVVEEVKIDICFFGHLHNLKKEKPMFGEVGGVKYILTSCDFLDFTPICIS